MLMSLSNGPPNLIAMLGMQRSALIMIPVFASTRYKKFETLSLGASKIVYLMTTECQCNIKNSEMPHQIFL